ncbi:D-2-hydroxyacid dehydrogenase [Lacticaseibacillus casei]|jgi:glycerate dehydrogenase|uniref:D-2-hydroxyacid dehydrogenase n=1 Tax=Lacticaseibacillus huelsenbergensis TaxID=3035291 RepID=A0ABY8DX40_9LACO|nr:MULTISPECIES: D-2-hydroxyacid dehydrogenase [Lacticaseibacillus]MDG3063070.1 D-2-hydroxyacid dehydrogenase [Lacticaseibacillus sp. BCRC 81376]MDN4553527.1 D-2-hydroxyacid dehydrogenase [Lacticaseibacillus paracasei]QVI36497.1 D-2-hydroxyacid dehydrogenase [Lacticaseibacillus casei]QXG58290.1 D-2-hydroxyacid dehydrogenase [Lacticaseibacillus casei]WFB40250.1 D-2-hydroxyacid dehydrogenase [Lacticaseibacillus huelsenbergensis]
MKIVLLDGYALNQDLDWGALCNLGECHFYDRTPNDDAKILARIGDADIILTHKTPLTAETIRTAPRLRYIGVMGDGYDVIDTEAASERHIPVTNVPIYATDAVAQFTFALLLEITSHVGLHNRLVHEGKWPTSPNFTFWAKKLVELKGKTLGLIGYGRIAQKVATIAHAFSMKVMFYNHRPKPHDPNISQQVSLDELLKQADIISLHVRQAPETLNMIRHETIEKMRPGTIIINTARGKLINEQDLAEALNNGKIAAAGLDVAQQEPISPDSPLLTAKNCYITPHIAWAPFETRERLLDITVANLKAFLEHHPQNVVNAK